MNVNPIYSIVLLSLTIDVPFTSFISREDCLK